MRAAPCSLRPIRSGKFKTPGPLQSRGRGGHREVAPICRQKTAPLGLVVVAACDRWARVVVMADGARAGAYPELVHPTPEPTWRLILLSDTRRLTCSSANTVFLTAVALAFVFRCFSTCTSADAQFTQVSPQALQRAHDELERKVAERTVDLAAANEQLGREVAAERQRAEYVLREAQDGLVQAGKMAVKGRQMAAGITHELQSAAGGCHARFSDNARLLLAKVFRTDDVQNNFRP